MTAKQFETEAITIASLDRMELTKRIKKFRGSFKLDFTEDYLNQSSLDRLRHILLSALIYSKPHNWKLSKKTEGFFISEKTFCILCNHPQPCYCREKKTLVKNLLFESHLHRLLWIKMLLYFFFLAAFLVTFFFATFFFATFFFATFFFAIIVSPPFGSQNPFIFLVTTTTLHNIKNFCKENTQKNKIIYIFFID